MVSWVFGEVKKSVVHIHDRAAGYFEFERARVICFLSINGDTLPANIKETGKTTYRSMTLEVEEIEFSDGFTDLHTKSYNNVIDGKGYRINEALNAIRIVHEIRNSEPLGLVGEFHPFANKKLVKHPSIC